MRCACGKIVRTGELNSVIIKGNDGQIKSVICGNCASFRRIRRTKAEDFKRKKFKPWTIPAELLDDDLDVIEKAR